MKLQLPVLIAIVSAGLLAPTAAAEAATKQKVKSQPSYHLQSAPGAPSTSSAVQSAVRAARDDAAGKAKRKGTQQSK